MNSARARSSLDHAGVRRQAAKSNANYDAFSQRRREWYRPRAECLVAMAWGQGQYTFILLKIRSRFVVSSYALLAMRLLPVILVTLGAVLQCAAYIYTLTCSGPLYNIKSAFANAGLLNPNLPDVGDDTYLATWYKDEVLVGTEFDQRGASSLDWLITT